MAEIEYDPASGKWGINPIEIGEHLKRLLSRTRSTPEREFIEVYRYLRDNRCELSKLAMQYHKETAGLEGPILGVNLLGSKSWLSSKLIELGPRQLKGLVLARETTTPRRNELFHRENQYLPWSFNYVENLESLNSNLPEPLRPRLFDAPTYQLLDFRQTPEQFSFTCCRNKYYAYINSCELLHFEFARAVWMQSVRRGESPFDQKLGSLPVPLRNGLDIFSFANRCVGIGVSTLLIEKNARDFMFLKHKRNTHSLIEAMNTEHVVPAGTFQPRREMPLANDLDFDIYRNILREFGEELLGHKDMEEVEADTIDIIQDRRIKGLHQLFVEGHAKAFFLGWGLDPLTTKAEFLTALVIDVPKLRATYRKFKFKDNWEGRHSPAPFTQDEIKNFVEGSYTQPAGAACARLAWEHRDQLLNSVV